MTLNLCETSALEEALVNYEFAEKQHSHFYVSVIRFSTVNACSKGGRKDASRVACGEGDATSGQLPLRRG